MTDGEFQEMLLRKWRNPKMERMKRERLGPLFAGIIDMLSDRETLAVLQEIELDHPGTIKRLVSFPD